MLRLVALVFLVIATAITARLALDRTCQGVPWERYVQDGARVYRSYTALCPAPDGSTHWVTIYRPWHRWRWLAISGSLTILVLADTAAVAVRRAKDAPLTAPA